VLSLVLSITRVKAIWKTPQISPIHPGRSVYRIQVERFFVYSTAANRVDFERDLDSEFGSLVWGNDVDKIPM
jgi:hypothetical protein